MADHAIVLVFSLLRLAAGIIIPNFSGLNKYNLVMGLRYRLLKNARYITEQCRAYLVCSEHDSQVAESEQQLESEVLRQRVVSGRRVERYKLHALQQVLQTNNKHVANRKSRSQPIPILG